MSTWMDDCGNEHHTCDDECGTGCTHCSRPGCTLDLDFETTWRQVGACEYLCPKCRKKFLRVLIVDDDTDLAAVLREGLDMEGHEPDVATTMAEVAALLGSKEYDVVLLDQQGGDIDRPRVGEVARAKGARIITMSGEHALVPDLPKPFRLEQLQAKLLGDLTG